MTDPAPSAPAPAPAAPRRPLDRFWVGLLAHPVLLVFFSILAASNAAPDTFSLFFMIGAVQAAFVIPVALAAWALGSRQFLKGFILAAGVLFLLNAGCWGLVLGVGVLSR